MYQCCGAGVKNEEKVIATSISIVLASVLEQF